MIHADSRGFTIVELMIATFLASAVSILMFGLTIWLYADQLQTSANSNMTLESQLFLNRLVNDIRVAGEVRQTNELSDANAPGGSWVTSDPANILVLTSPAVDANDLFIIDPLTGDIYQNEIVYFGSGTNMYRRVIANSNASGNAARTTCPASISSASCPQDIKLSENLENLLFNFFDINNTPTSVIADTRAVELTVNLSKTVYGKPVAVSTTTKATMRNSVN